MRGEIESGPVARPIGQSIGGFVTRELDGLSALWAARIASHGVNVAVGISTPHIECQAMPIRRPPGAARETLECSNPLLRLAVGTGNPDLGEPRPVAAESQHPGTGHRHIVISHQGCHQTNRFPSRHGNPPDVRIIERVRPYQPVDGSRRLNRMGFNAKAGQTGGRRR